MDYARSRAAWLAYGLLASAYPKRRFRELPRQARRLSNLALDTARDIAGPGREAHGAVSNEAACPGHQEKSPSFLVVL